MRSWRSCKLLLDNDFTDLIKKNEKSKLFNKKNCENDENK